MKTCLYTACYLDGEDDSGSSRFERNLRYLNYYRPLKEVLGFQDFWFCDNASTRFSEFIRVANGPDLNVYRYGQHLPRGGKTKMPYAWRAFHFLNQLIEKGYEKIICIDSDGFILTKRLADYVRGFNTGWTAFFDEVHKFPTAEFHILNKDSFDRVLGFNAVPWTLKDGMLMEHTLPFKEINKDFKVGRFGEWKWKQDDSTDFYGQASLDIELEFEK